MRVYKEAQNEGMYIVIFSTTKTEAREPLFKSVGLMAKTKVAIISMKDRDIRLDSPADYINESFVAIREDIGEHLLKEKNAVNVQSVTKVESALQMLKSGRAHAFAYEENVGK